jgi:hypothetical protein
MVDDRNKPISKHQSLRKLVVNKIKSILLNITDTAPAVTVAASALYWNTRSPRLNVAPVL